MLLLTFVILILAKELFALPSYNRRQDVEDSPFICNSYNSVNQWINRNRNESVIFAKGEEITEDGRVNQREAMEIVEVWCREYARVASQLEIEAVDCPNFDDIYNAMNHLGPVCTRSGNVNSFAMDVMQQFTEITLSPECNSQIYGAAMGCDDGNYGTYSGTQFVTDSRTAESNASHGLRCAVGALSNVTACGSVKPAYVIVYVTTNALFGVELKYADIF